MYSLFLLDSNQKIPAGSPGGAPLAEGGSASGPDWRGAFRTTEPALDPHPAKINDVVLRKKCVANVMNADRGAAVGASRGCCRIERLVTIRASKVLIRCSVASTAEQDVRDSRIMLVGTAFF
jgi:hypothetical protein